MIPKSRSIIAVMAVFTAIGVLLGGTALTEWVDPKLLGLVTLIYVAARAGVDYFFQASANIEAPRVAVALTGRMEQGQVVARDATAVAGPGSPVPTGEELNPQSTVAAVTPPPAPAKDDLGI